MVAGTFVIEIILTFTVVAIVLYRYGNWYLHHVIVTVSVLTAWYFSMLIVFVLPLDVSNTIYETCLKNHSSVNSSVLVHLGGLNSTHFNNESMYINPKSIELLNFCQKPWSYVPSSVFPVFWRIVYWSSQCLTWILLPLMQSYTKAGDFSFRSKLRSAVVDNAIYYGSYLFIVGILLIYIAFKPELSLHNAKLRTIASTASNTWGLFWLVLLLGYGLVEVPRSIWNMASTQISLNKEYFKTAKLSHERADTDDHLNDLLHSMHAFNNSIPIGSSLKGFMNIIECKVPAELLDSSRQRQRFDIDSPQSDAPTEKALIRLHKQLLKALQHHKRVETQWGLLVDDILWLEDVHKNSFSPDHYFKTSITAPRHYIIEQIYPPVIEWFWECRLRSWLLRTLALAFAIISAAVIWSELTFFVKQPTLSLFAIFVNLAQNNDNYFAIEVIASVTMAYIALCAYSTLFKVRVLNLYYLAPHHQTDEYSLIFSGMMLCRLTPPMCLNFLSLIHMDSHIIENQTEETHFTQIMGHMDVISIISDGFNIYFPMMIVALCLATYYNLGSRLLSALGFQQFIGDDELTVDLIDEGRTIISREARKKQRIIDSASRRQEFSKRFASGESVSNFYRSARQRAENLVRPKRSSPESPQLELLGDPQHQMMDYSSSTSTINLEMKSNLYRSRPNKPDINLFDDV